MLSLIDEYAIIPHKKKMFHHCHLPFGIPARGLPSSKHIKSKFNYPVCLKQLCVTFSFGPDSDDVDALRAHTKRVSDKS